MSRPGRQKETRKGRKEEHTGVSLTADTSRWSSLARCLSSSFSDWLCVSSSFSCSTWQERRASPWPQHFSHHSRWPHAAYLNSLHAEIRYEDHLLHIRPYRWVDWHMKIWHCQCSHSSYKYLIDAWLTEMINWSVKKGVNHTVYDV